MSGGTTVSPATSHQPRIWNVPLGRNLNFTGRENLLIDLSAKLHANHAAALTQTQAIHGLGGVGKTQIALEYAYRHAHEYELVWWVHAEQPATMIEDLTRLARELDLAEKDARDQSLVVQAVCRALRDRDRWLLVFDNAISPEELHGLLPEGNGHILITSRHHAWRSVAGPLPVETMERDEAIAFLLKRTGQTDRDAANKLADALGDLPLALEQAGAFIEDKLLALSEYLPLFTARRQELLKTNKPIDYPDTVATTWNLSFDQVEKESAAASELLNLCAFFAPDDIPLDVLKGGARHLSGLLAQAMADKLELSKGIAPLLRFSLMTRAGSMVSVHRLVQAVARDRMVDPERRHYAEAAAQIVNDAFPKGSNDVRIWDVCAQLLPHSLAATDHASALDVAPAATGHVLNECAVYLRARGQFRDAKQLYEQALKINEAIYGPDHATVATSVNNLGMVLQDLGDLPGAKDCFERALEIGEAARGPDDPHVAIWLSNLGVAMEDLGDFAGAKTCLERALRVDEAAYGPDHPDVAIRVNNLGNVLQDLGDLAGAEACFERALKIDEAAYGPDHPNVAATVNNLGAVLRALGDLACAKAYFERALKIDETAYGADHPNVATTVSNLGSVLRDLGDLAGAKACGERALKITEVAYGPDHPDVAIRVSNLGNVLQDLGDLAGAKAYFERAMKIDEAAYSPDHPTVATIVNNLGSVLQDLGDLAGAKACYERALKIDEAAHGSDHPNVAIGVNNLGGVLQGLGDLAGARNCYDRALAILRKFFDENHPNVRTVKDNLDSLGSRS